MPSISTENYLKAVFHLQRDSDRVTTSALAEMLGVTHPSATKMIKALAGAGWIDHIPYGGVRLTDAGERAALRVIRKHRLIEVFLVDVLGYGWDEVHDEAERLEHAVSDALADRLDVFLGYPAHDPHGDPIPNSRGELVRRDAVSLAELEAGRPARVTRVLDQDTAVLRYLAEVGVRPDAAVTVIEAMPFEGPLRLRVGDADAVLGRPLARRVLVALEPDPGPG